MATGQWDEILFETRKKTRRDHIMSSDLSAGGAVLLQSSDHHWLR